MAHNKDLYWCTNGKAIRTRILHTRVDAALGAGDGLRKMELAFATKFAHTINKPITVDACSRGEYGEKLAFTYRRYKVI